MTLTAELFDQVASATGGGPAHHEERRVSRRLGLRATVSVLVPESGTIARRSVVVRDISTTGVGLLLHAPMRRGELLVLELAQTDAPPRRVACEVRRCQLVPGGLYVVGLGFRKATTPKPAPAASPRQNPRTPTPPPPRFPTTNPTRSKPPPSRTASAPPSWNEPRQGEAELPVVSTTA